MKHLSILIPGSLLLLLAIGCGPTNTEQIGRNVDPDVTSLSDVKTYSWITDIDRIPDAKAFVSSTGIYVYNNESTRNNIKEAIEYELDARGYKMRNKEDQGMLVSFLVLEQADSLRTTNGYMTISGEPVISSEDVEWTPVEAGTLIISLVDKATDKMVWQGFASGILKPEDINDEARIRQAVSSIFSRFSYDAR